MNEQIDILIIAKRIIAKKWLFVKISIAVFFLSCALILPVPRYYNSSVTLAPEIGDIVANSNLMNIASSFGFNIGNSSTGDAIYPELYPKLITSNDFIINLISHNVTTADKSITTTYYEYIKKHQKNNPLMAPISWIKKLFKDKKDSSSPYVNLFQLTKEQDDIFNFIKKKINCNIDVKTGLIHITVEDQDPVIAATIANITKDELQKFITKYRTNKARIDYEYFKQLTIEAKQQYEKARQLYGSYADANMDVLLESYRLKNADLENDMQLKYNTYSALNAQLQSAQAKVQEVTPAFTIVNSATVPLLPSGPKRMAFVLIMVIMSWIITTLYITKDLFIVLFSKK